MIPVNESLIGVKEIEYVNECLHTGWISSAGRFIEEFEQKWAAYCGMKYGIAMSNGTTAALQAAVGCIGLQPGDKAVMPVHIYGHPVDVALGVSRATCGTAGT